MFIFLFRKKLRAEISKQFSDFPPDDLANIIPNKEEMSVMKVYTHSGENVIVYILQKCPIFFELHKVLYPTGVFISLKTQYKLVFQEMSRLHVNVSYIE